MFCLVCLWIFVCFFLSFSVFFFFSAERKPRRNKSRRSVELPKTHRWHLWSTSGGLDKVLSLTLRSFYLFLYYFFLLLVRCSFTTPSNISPGICHPFPCAVSLYPDAQHVGDEMWAPDPLQLDQRRTFSSTAAYCVQQSNSGLDWFDVLSSSSSSSMWLDRDGRPLIAATGKFWSFFLFRSMLELLAGWLLGVSCFQQKPGSKASAFCCFPCSQFLVSLLQGRVERHSDSNSHPSATNSLWLASRAWF